MTGAAFEPCADEWSDWLLHRRHADDPEHERAIRAETQRCADRVLDGARLAPGMTILDVGAGDGMVAFRAIARIGPELRVVLADISVPLLRHAATVAAERQIAGQCEFLPCSADDLRPIAAGSVDVVVTRAALAYVTDKPKAFREFRRVLKPGGRLSIAEPIFWDEAIAVSAMKNLIDARSPGNRDPLLPLLHRWKAAQFPDTPEKIASNPISNYSERDLVRFAQESGFCDIHLEFHIDVSPSVITSWEVFLGSSPHPWAPSLGAILAEQFAPEERQLFEPFLRSLIGAPRTAAVTRIAYLAAAQPSA
jgi:arsenite methyltransferase